MNTSDKSRNPFVIVLFAFLSAGAAIFIIQAIRSINVQQDIQFPEGAVIFGIASLLHKEPLYRDFHQAPFAIMPYPPLFYLLSAAVSKLFAHSVHAIYVSARAIDLIASIGTAILAAKVVGQAKCRRMAQISAALLFLGSSIMQPWGFMARVDTLMLLFSILGLYLFLKFKGSNWQYLAVIAFVLAIFSKQSSLAAPAAVFGMLILERKWKQSFLFAAGIGLLTVGCFLLTDYLTHGLFSLNVIGGLASPILRWRSVWELLRWTFSGLLLPLALSTVTLCAFLWNKLAKRESEGSEPVIMLFGLYLLAALALGAMSSTKLGSDRNYYLPALLAASVLGGVAVELLRYSRQIEGSRAILLACLVIVAALPDLKVNSRTMGSHDFVREDNSPIIESLKPLPGDILTDDANIAMRLDKPVFATDAYHLSVMISSGLWQPDPLISLIDQRHFQAVILPFNIGSKDRPNWAAFQGLERWDKRILNAIDANYILKEIHGDHYTYYKR